MNKDLIGINENDHRLKHNHTSLDKREINITSTPQHSIKDPMNKLKFTNIKWDLNQTHTDNSAVKIELSFFLSYLIKKN